MAVDPQIIADRAAAKLKIDSADALPYAQAAIDHFANYTGRTGDDGSEDPPPELPADDQQLLIGCELLTMRMWSDTPTPTGGISSFDDFTAGSFTPKVLLSHLDQYAMHLVIAWGFA